jgi:hypothetical protein
VYVKDSFCFDEISWNPFLDAERFGMLKRVCVCVCVSVCVCVCGALFDSHQQKKRKIVNSEKQVFILSRPGIQAREREGSLAWMLERGGMGNVKQE